jgi:hypothetical protein
LAVKAAIGRPASPVELSVGELNERIALRIWI